MRRFSKSVCLITITLSIGHAAQAFAQQPARPDGWVVIPVDEYRALRLKAFPPDRPPDPPPIDATITRVEYELRTEGESAAGEARLIVDVFKEGWVRVDVPAGLLVRAARVDGRTVSLVDTPSPHILLSKAGRFTVSLEVVLPLKVSAGIEALTVPPSRGAVSRLGLVVPRQGIDVIVAGGVLAERAQAADARWVAYGRSGQPLTVSWKRRAEERGTQALRWRGTIVEHVGLGEDTSPLTATVNLDVFQGVAPAIDVAVPDGVLINQVSGPLVAEWDFRGGQLHVTFLEPITGAASFTIGGEARLPRDGSVVVPLIRLPAAERESGGVAVEVLGAGEVADRLPRGLEPADPSELGGPIAGRDSPSMVAFSYRAQPGSIARGLTVGIARYTPQAVLVANVEEARYDALIDEEGKTIVRARYAVRNNQRAFLAVTLPAGATLWSAAVAHRPLKPGVAAGGALLLPLRKGRAGEETPAFAVEVTYVQRAGAWADRGRMALPLPAVDLPVARTGVVLHHSPRFRIDPEPGVFRPEPDNGPFTMALRDEVALPESEAQPVYLDELRAPAWPSAPAEEDLVAKYRRESAGRTLAGLLPARVAFPRFGPSVFLMSELTAELQAPSIEFFYKRESRW
jgi:hypothetical protein